MKFPLGLSCARSVTQRIHTCNEPHPPTRSGSDAKQETSRSYITQRWLL